jgi:hypothetical protein
MPPNKGNHANPAAPRQGVLTPPDKIILVAARVAAITVAAGGTGCVLAVDEKCLIGAVRPCSQGDADQREADDDFAFHDLPFSVLLTDASKGEHCALRVRLTRERLGSQCSLLLVLAEGIEPMTNDLAAPYLCFSPSKSLSGCGNLDKSLECCSGRSFSSLRQYGQVLVVDILRMDAFLPNHKDSTCCLIAIKSICVSLALLGFHNSRSATMDFLDTCLQLLLIFWRLGIYCCNTAQTYFSLA